MPCSRIAEGKTPGATVAKTLKRYATPVPRAMSVNMFRLRFVTEAQPRSKSGHPAQSTTGVASTSSIHGIHRPSACCTGIPGRKSDIPSTKTGTVNTRLAQNLRLMSSSSGFRSSTATVRGSRAIPQIGHAPGPVRTISGCIGHVQVAPAGAEAGFDFGARYFSGSAIQIDRHAANGIDSRASCHCHVLHHRAPGAWWWCRIGSPVSPATLWATVPGGFS